MSSQLKLTPILIPLLTPITVQNQTTHARKGLLLKLSANGVSGMGECLPLAGLHSESIEECFNHLSLIIPLVQKWHLSKKKITYLDLRLLYFGLIHFTPSLPPSCEFALEQALMHLLIQSGQLDMGQTMTQGKNFFCGAINGLILSQEGKIEEIANHISENQLSSVKIKIGRQPSRESLDQEIQFVQSLSQALSHQVKLRLDANRSLSLDELRYFWDHICLLPIDYFEEPLKGTFAETKKIYSHLDLPIALDESLLSYLPLSTLPSSVRALVIKPSTLGGISETLKIIDFCNQSKVSCVLSSAFDTGWAISFYVLISQAIFNPAPMGLDTYRYLEVDLLKKRLPFKNQEICLSDAFFRQTPDELLRDFSAELTA